MAQSSTRVAHIANLVQAAINNKTHCLASKSIHAQIIRTGSFSDVFLCNRLIELYSKLNFLDHAVKVFDTMPERNVFTWNAMLSAFLKSDNIELARKLFEEIPKKNVVSWNTMISALVRSGSEGKAVELYYDMIRVGFMPTRFTFASVLSGCGSLESLENGRRCHGLSVKVGLDSNLFVENGLLGMYGKCGRNAEAIRVFRGMSQPNEVSFTAMMGCLKQSGSLEDAFRLFRDMHGQGIVVDSVAVSCVLGACARAENEVLSFGCGDIQFSSIILGQSVQALAIKFGFESDLHVSNTLMDVYAKYDDMASAELIFKSLPYHNIVSWNVLVAGYGQRGDSDKATEVLQSMSEDGFEPDEVTYIGMLGAHVKSGDILAACQMFDKISKPMTASWNALLSGYCQEESYEKSIALFREMQMSNVKPDRATLAVILSSCSGLGALQLGKQIHAASTRAILHIDVFVSSGLVDMYSKCGNLELAKLVFDRMLERDVVSWNSMMSAFALHSLTREAFSLFKQMRKEGTLPTASSYASVVTSCARLSSLPQGRQIHAQIAKESFDCDVIVGSALIDMYAKCGEIENARRYFDYMPVRNIVSWNEIIHGYAQNGLGDKAVELFKHMLTSKEIPDSVTFIAVLTACSHAGLVDEGIKFFDSMDKDYGIKPLADHYTCIIDMLGRAGCLSEASKLLENMPYTDDPILWEVLLNASCLHLDASLGRRAAEELFQIDPQNSSPYVLLSNIYAALGRWDDVRAVRTLMSNQGIAKDRGYSWIDHKKGVRAFMVGDASRIVNSV